MNKKSGWLWRITVLLGMLFQAQSVLAAEHCIILQYHHFGTDTPPSTSISPALFDEHLDYLAEHGHQVLPVDQVLEAMHGNKPLPDKCVAITIDDAYISIYTEAFPRLRKRGWPFTVYVNSQGVDDGKRVYMSWEQMREMGRAGVQFGNHSASHAHLIRRLDGETQAAWSARVRQDIQTAQQRIEKELGQSPTSFVYPYGEFDPALKEIVADLKLNGLGQHSGPAWPGQDFQAVPRFPMAAGFAAMKQFPTKVKSLPLPVLRAEPDNPLLPVIEWRPGLRLRLAEGDYQRKQIRCFVSGQGLAELKWLDSGALQVRAKGPLGVGRNRYNCTAPTTSGGRYYWYSHPWIRRHQDGSWYRE